MKQKPKPMSQVNDNRKKCKYHLFYNEVDCFGSNKWVDRLRYIIRIEERDSYFNEEIVSIIENWCTGCVISCKCPIK